MKGDKLLIGTGKGLIIFLRDQRTQKWKYNRVHFLGFPVSQVYVHPFTEDWWVALSHRHWGPKLHRSKDQGRHWEAISPPSFPPDALLRNGTPASLRMIWMLSHAGKEFPDQMWVGTEPGGLFHMYEEGRKWELVESLWNHPSRKTDWFGAGGSHYPGIHSIEIDPHHSDHLYVGISIAGVFFSPDRGKSWEVRNKGLRADYLPNPSVEVGHDPHRLLICQAVPHVIWQQNHCGVYRSTDRGLSWHNISEEGGFVHYGFALAVDPADQDRAWVIPAISDEVRVASELSLCVFRTDDGGKTWNAQQNGLPEEACFDIVFRHGLALHENQLAFGTTTGNVFLSDNLGDQWICLSNYLPRVHVITFA